jgi:hypothetical protein
VCPERGCGIVEGGFVMLGESTREQVVPVVVNMFFAERAWWWAGLSKIGSWSFWPIKRW